MDKETNVIEKKGKLKATKFKLVDMNESIELFKDKFSLDTWKVVLAKYMRSEWPATSRRNNLKKNFPMVEDFLTKNWNRGSNWRYLDGNEQPWFKFLSMKWFPIFKLKRIFFQDNRYVFESEDGNFYYTDIQEFNEKWIMLESLKIWRPELSSENHGVREFLIEADTSGIKIRKGWNIKTTIPWELVTIMKKDEAKILVVNKNRFEITTVNEDGTYDQESPIAHSYGKIEKIRTDRNENFIFVIGQHGEWVYKLHILNRNTLQEIDNIPDIKDIIFIDEKDDMNCLSKDNKVIYVDTNFDQFPKGYVDGWELINEKEQVVTKIEDKPRSELSDALQNGWIHVDLNGLLNGEGIEVVSDNTDDEKIRDKIWKIVIDEEHKKTLRDLYTEADDEQKADVLWWVVNKIKMDPKINSVKWIMDPIETLVSKKRSEIKLQKIWNEMKDIADNLWMTDDLITLVGIQSKLEELKKKRGQIIVWPGEKDKELKDIIKLTKEKIQEYRDGHQEETTQAIEWNVKQIESFLSSIEYLTQITSVYKTDLWIDTKKLIELLWDEQKELFEKKLDEVVRMRQKELSEDSNKRREKEKQKIEKKVEEVKNDIVQLESILQSIEDEESLDIIKKSDPLVNKILEAIHELPDNKGQELSVQLDNIFQQRIFRIKLEKYESKWVIKSLDEYGVDTMLYYNESEVRNTHREVEWNRDARGKVKLQISIEDGKYVYDCDAYFKDPEKYADVIVWDDVKFEMTQSEFLKYSKKLGEWKSKGKERLKNLYKVFNEKKTKEEKNGVIQEIKKLKETYKEARYTEILVSRLLEKLKISTRPFLATFDPRFIVLDEEKAILEELSARLVNQKIEKRGIDILEWWPWLGKTEMCKFLAAVTNREIIRIQCSKMDPADMFFSPQLKKWETSREAADWIKLMQKPWTIILFDEIDKLNDQCFERLHSLFDGDKSVYDPQIGRMYANADCLFLGTRNSYEKMWNPIVSRSRIQMIEYPSMQNEAYKVSKYTNNDFLAKLSYDDFIKLREKYVVQASGWPKNTNEKKIYDAIVNIKHLLNIFNQLRKKYDSDSFDDKFEYELSYRDAHHIFIDYNADPKQTFKKSIKDILIPKVRAVVQSKEDKDLQSSIVNKIIDAEMK